MTTQHPEYGECQQLTMESIERALQRGLLAELRARDTVTGDDQVELYVPRPEAGDYLLANEAVEHMMAERRPSAVAIYPLSVVRTVGKASGDGEHFTQQVAYTLAVHVAWRGPDHRESEVWPGLARGAVGAVTRVETRRELVSRVARRIVTPAVVAAVMKRATGPAGTIDIMLGSDGASGALTDDAGLLGKAVVPFDIIQNIRVPRLRGAA